MKKILLILTGGTIGSEKTKNIINIGKNSYLKSFLSKIDKKINYKIVQPINILSENLIPNDWNIIIKCIKDNWNSNFSGIIITHGTDTLSFTSSAIAQYFYNFNKPIILVSSDKPLKEKSSNGRMNIKASIAFINKTKIPGTYVAFKNTDENYVSFFLGSRTKQINSYDNILNSRYSDIFCKFINKKFIFIKRNNPSIPSIKKNCYSNKLNNHLSFSNKILIIKPYPGLNYNFYVFNKNKPKAILHGLYHSGTASNRNVTGYNVSLLEFIKSSRKKKIPIFISPLSSKTKNIYITLKSFLDSKVRFLDGITFETAYAKLSLVYKSFKNDKKRNNFLKKNNFFEKIKF